MTTTTALPRPSGPTAPTSIGLVRAVRAELVRARRSAAARLPWIGLVLALIQGLLWLSAAAGPASSWASLFAWQTMYGQGLVAPLACLIAGLAAGREKAAREGGTAWRPLRPATATTARLLVLTAQLIALDALVTLPLLGFGALSGLPGLPWGQGLAVWAALVAAGLPALVLGFAIARVGGTIVAVVVGVVWQIGGLVPAEEPWAALFPPSWGMRALLPMLGVHANGVALEPDSPIRAWPWGWPMLGCVLLAVVIAAVLAGTTRAEAGRAVRIAGLRRLLGGGRGGAAGRASAAERPAAIAPSERRRALAVPAGGGRPRPFAASAAAMRRTFAWPLVGVTVVVLAVAALLWDHRYPTGLAVWFAVPLGCCILAVLATTAVRPALRVTLLRRSARAEAVSLAAICLTMLSAVVVATGLAAVLSGAAPLDALRVAVLLWAVGAALLGADLWLATRIGPAAAFAMTLALMVVSMILGGTAIARTPLWILAVAGWPIAADSPGRAVVALVASAVIGGAAWWGWTRALRRAAAIG